MGGVVAGKPGWPVAGTLSVGPGDRRGPRLEGKAIWWTEKPVRRLRLQKIPDRLWTGELYDQISFYRGNVLADCGRRVYKE